MSTDELTELEIDFYLSSSPNVAILECFEISHPNFSKTHLITSSDCFGFEALDENGILKKYDYLPMGFNGSAMTTDLDYAIQISTGDLGEILPKELDLIDAADGWDVYPVVVYRAYRSDRLDRPMRGPIELELSNYTYNNTGMAFKAEAPDIKSSATGEIFSFERFQTLYGFFA